MRLETSWWTLGFASGATEGVRSPVVAAMPASPSLDLLTNTPVLTPWAAIADESPAPSCGYADLQGLPTVLVKASNQASGGGGRGTQKVLQDEPLLADSKRFSAALDACAAEDSAKKEALAKFASLEEEIQYNLGKSFDPRWPDEDDIADLTNMGGPLSKEQNRS